MEGCAKKGGEGNHRRHECFNGTYAHQMLTVAGGIVVCHARGSLFGTRWARGADCAWREYADACQLRAADTFTDAAR